MKSTVVASWLFCRAADLVLAVVIALGMNMVSGDLGSVSDAASTAGLGIVAYAVVTFGAAFFATSYLWIWFTIRIIRAPTIIMAAGSGVLLWLSLTGIYLFGLRDISRLRLDDLFDLRIVLIVMAHAALSFLVFRKVQGWREL